MAVVCSLIAIYKALEDNPRDYLNDIIEMPRIYFNDIIEKMPRMKDTTQEEQVQLLQHKWKLQYSTD